MHLKTNNILFLKNYLSFLYNIDEYNICDKTNF